MSMLHEALRSDVAYHLGWMLLHSLWLITGLAFVMGAFLKLTPTRCCNLRYGMSCIMLVLMLGAVGLASLWVPQRAAEVVAQLPVRDEQPAPSPAAVPALEDHGQSPAPAIVPNPPGVPPVENAAQPSLAANPDVSDSPAPIVSPQPQPEAASEEQPGDISVAWLDRAVAFARPWVAWAVPVWLVGVLAVGIWHLGGFIAAQRLRRIGTRPAPEHAVALLNTLGERIGIKRAVTILESAVVQSPAVIGWLKPVVLIPTCVLTGMPREQLEVIIAHELAHIRRHDYVINLIQTLIVTLLFYHPAVWWMSRQIRNERECCCDVMVVKLTDRKLDYAKALAHIATMHAPRPGLLVAANSGSLVERLRRLAGLDDTVGVSPKAWLAGLVLLACALVLPITWATGEGGEIADLTDDQTEQVFDPVKAILGRWHLVQEGDQKLPESDYTFDFTEQGTMIGREGDRIEFDMDYRLEVDAEQGAEESESKNREVWSGTLHTTDQQGKVQQSTIQLRDNELRLNSGDGADAIVLRRADRGGPDDEQLNADAQGNDPPAADPTEAILGKWYGQFVDSHYLPSDNWCVWEFRADCTNAYTLGEGEPVGNVDPNRSESMVTDYKIDDQGRLVLYLPGEEPKVCPFEIRNDSIYLSVDHPNDFVFTREPNPEAYKKERNVARIERASHRVQAQLINLHNQWIRQSVGPNKRQPEGLAELAAKDPAMALTPLRPDITLPEQYNDWDPARQNEWLDDNAGFVYLPVPITGEIIDALPPGHVLLFERPTPGRVELYAARVDEQGNIGFALDPIPIEQLDAILKEQTGKGLDAWAFKDDAEIGQAPGEAEVAAENDYELLLEVAKMHRENAEQIRSWTGKADVTDVRVDPKGDGHRMTSEAEFLNDQQQGKRWRWEVTAAEKTVDGVSSEDPRQISVTDQMIHGDVFYQCAAGFKPAGSNEWQRTMVILPVERSGEHIGMKSRSLDPYWYLTNDGMPIASRLTWLHEHKDEIENLRVTREGSVVTVENVLGNSINRDQYDLDQGGNLISSHASNGFTAVWDTKISYTRVEGVWVPSHYKQTSQILNSGLREREVTFTDQVLNAPVGEEQFTMEAMGIQPGARVTDHVKGLFYEYPDVANARKLKSAVARERARDDANIITIHELTYWEDGGTMGVAYTPPGGERAEIAIDVRMDKFHDPDNTTLRLYVGAMHPEHEGAKLVEQDSDLERQVFAALRGWVDHHFTAEELAAILDDPNIGERPEAEEWALRIARRLEDIRRHRLAQRLSIYPASSERQEDGHNIPADLPGQERVVYYTPGDALLTLDDVFDARLGEGELGEPSLTLKLKPEAGERLEAYTREHLGQPLLIMIEGKPVSAPIVQGILRDSLMITGGGDAAEDLFRPVIEVFKSYNAWGETVGGLRCRLVPPSSPFVVGEKPTVQVVLHNVSNEPVIWGHSQLYINLPGADAAGFAQVQLDKSQRARVATAAEVGEAFGIGRPDLQGQDPFPGFIHLEPQGEAVFSVQLDAPLIRPGRYQVQAREAFRDNVARRPEELLACPPMVIAVVEPGKQTPPLEDPTRWPEGAWGPEVEGMQVRLNDKSFHNPGKVPALCLDLRNFGERKMQFVQGMENYEIEVDGVWYRAGVIHTGGVDVLPLSPGNRWQDVYWLPLEAFEWQDAQGNKLVLNPEGGHTFRVAIKLDPQEAGAGERVRLVTNAIKPKPAEAEVIEQ